MNKENFKEEILDYCTQISQWMEKFPEYTCDETLNIDMKQYLSSKKDFIHKLHNNYPFHHPLYAGQLLKPPHPVAVLGYFTAMLINPNNHALDGGPATAEMEKEVIDLFAHKFGFRSYLGHLTTSGAIANLEALWISREIFPDKYVVFSNQAHYTHERNCSLLKLKYKILPSKANGKLNIEELKSFLEQHKTGTVVVTLGTTGLGALDELDKILELKNTYGFRIHVDAAYGGYYKIISKFEKHIAVFDLISECDSFAFDPHKHGLQPYGCGCIIYKDPEVGKYYKHDSPYTYFTSKELHLGEISLECSRPGASAAALWLTMQCFAMDYDKGFGPILKKTRMAAKKLADKISNSMYYTLYINPELDIVTYFPDAASTENISKLSETIFEYLMNDTYNGLYIAKLKVSSDHFRVLHPDIEINTEYVTVFRSCLMKPEHFQWVDKIISILEEQYLIAIAN